MPGLLRRAAEAYGLADARRHGRTAWLLTLGTLILGTGRGVVAPFLVLYLTRERGLDLGFVGLAITLEFAVRALVGPVAGALSDRIGRKPLMVTGLLATSVLLPAYLLVRTPTDFLVVSVLNGLVAAHSLYGPASSALVVDSVPSGRRGAVFGLLHASRNLGWTLGIALGALLIGQGFLPIFLVAGVLPFAFLLVMLPLVHDPPKPRGDAPPPAMYRQWGAVLRTPAFVAYLALATVFYLGWGQVNTIFPLFLTEGLGLGDHAVAILAVNSVLVVALQLPFGRLADRADRPRLLAFAAIALGAAHAVYAAAPLLASDVPPLLTVGAGMVLFTLAEMLFSPILSAYAADLVGPRAVGSALGILTFAQAAGQGIPPVLADLVVPRGGWEGVWLLLSLACAASAMGFVALGRRVRGPSG